MSDGPHRSLPMTKGWKRLAERSDGKLHTTEQVRDALLRALADDWKEERCDDFMSNVKDVLLGKDQDSLFKPTKSEMANALKNLPGSGYPLRRILVDALVQAIEDGHTGEQAMVRGAADALAIRCSARARQVEEHYVRASTEHRAADVRIRIEEGASRSDFEAMSRQFCKLEKASPRNNYDGLDDGVLTQ